MGKTALAVRAARLLPGSTRTGRCYLNLHSNEHSGSLLLDPAEALHRLLEMMSLAVQIPETVGERTALWLAHAVAFRAVVPGRRGRA